MASPATSTHSARNARAQGIKPTTTPMNTEDLTLAKALLEFIAPLVQLVDPRKKIDKNVTITAHETSNLIHALRGFISSAINNSKPSNAAGTKIDVELGSEEWGATGRNDPAARSSEVNVAPTASTPNSMESPHYTVEQTLFSDLRDHVFNQMPIRLFSFEQRGSTLEVVLLERTAILTRLQSKLRKILDTKRLSLNPYKIATNDDKVIIRDLISANASYAILSHTWLRSDPGEVTYGDWINGRLNSNDPGYRKLTNFCKVSWTNHKVSFAWMDTVCINKDSSAELDESIRSMYNWYKHANICIIYLAQTEELVDIPNDPWFTRGWTLQELLAPRVAKVYDKHWKQFINHTRNDKPMLKVPIDHDGEKSSLNSGSRDIVAQIQNATTISPSELADINSASLSRRMQLAANREVTRAEDMAYSLIGIFNISMTTAYGEGGERAFSRLLHEILNSSYSTKAGILDLFNWSGAKVSPTSRILPSHPRQYLSRSDSILTRLQKMVPLEPLTLTHAGVRIPVLLMPGISFRGDKPRIRPSGAFSAIACISPVHRESIPTNYCLLDSGVSGVDGPRGPDEAIWQVTFAVLNIEPHSQNVRLPSICIAIPIRCPEEAGKVTSAGFFQRIRTEKPVVFNMYKRNGPTPGGSELSTNLFTPVKEGEISLKLDDLEKHGMQLVIKHM